MDTYDLQRFLNAQQGAYAQALQEIRSGRKTSHWIWFVFPQHRALGHSRFAVYYGISGLDEANAYLREPTLRARLLEISEALLGLETDDPGQVMGGHPDDRKLQSSMTLFAAAEPDNPVFGAVLEKYFGGTPDLQTLKLLKA